MLRFSKFQKIVLHFLVFIEPPDRPRPVSHHKVSRVDVHCRFDVRPTEIQKGGRVGNVLVGGIPGTPNKLTFGRCVAAVSIVAHFLTVGFPNMPCGLFSRGNGTAKVASVESQLGFQAIEGRLGRAAGVTQNNQL